MLKNILPTNSSDFVVIGDVLVDHYVKVPDDVELTRHPLKETLEIPFPTKIPLHEPMRSMPGGNAFTVSMVLAKLGLNTQIYTELGGDADGQKLLNKLSQLNVGTSLVKMHEGEASTNSALILSATGDRVIFSYHYPRDYQLPELPSASHVYLTSVGEDDKKLFDQIVKAKKEKGFKLCFSPGSKQLKQDFSEIEGVMKHTDLLLLNKDEAQKVGRSESEDDEFLVKKLADLGPKSVVMTKSASGSVAYHEGKIFKVGALKVDVVETTGAGDTFSATVCAGLAKGLQIDQAMEMASIHSACVVQGVGCEAHLETIEGLERLHQEKRLQLEFKE